MTATATAPGIAFEVVPPPAAPAPLRSDVAGFLGATRRGPVGEAVRVAEWRDFARLFGGLDPEADTSYAVRSYFENGGEIAYVARLAGPGIAGAAAPWPGPGQADLPGHRHPAAGLLVSRAFLDPGGQALGAFTVHAATPGRWANGGRVRIDYRRRGAGDGAEVDVETRIPGEPAEALRGLPAAGAGALAAAVAARSRYLRLEPDPASLQPPAADPGPNRLTWELTLAGGADDPPRAAEYLAGVAALGHQRQVAFTALPDLYRHLPYDVGGASPEPAAFAVLRAAGAEAERRHDRLVLVDLPADPRREGSLDAAEVAAVLDALDDLLDPAERRAAAVYHPRVWVRDPLGGTSRPQRLIPASGPVAGLISRLDRQRGAHHTPANAPLVDAVDVAVGFDAGDQGRLNARGVNLVRCFPNRGLVVWGGRTLDRRPEGRFVAHRRLVHRLVRAIRRVAEPLVFDPEGPELWFTLVRAITSVLLAAFRAGALKGARPEEGFRVRCDDETNPPAERELGRVLCEIELAPAVPMEFITLRVALGRGGELEVFEP